jgi:hypothetical protein
MTDKFNAILVAGLLQSRVHTNVFRDICGQLLLSYQLIFSHYISLTKYINFESYEFLTLFFTHKRSHSVNYRQVQQRDSDWLIIVKQQERGGYTSQPQTSPIATV